MLTFHELLLSVLLIQINDDRPNWLLWFPLLAHHKALLHGQQAVHLIAHQQNSPVFGPVFHHFGPGHCCSAQTDRQRESWSTSRTTCLATCQPTHLCSSLRIWTLKERPTMTEGSVSGQRLSWGGSQRLNSVSQFWSVFTCHEGNTAMSVHQAK